MEIWQLVAQAEKLKTMNLREMRKRETEIDTERVWDTWHMVNITITITITVKVKAKVRYRFSVNWVSSKLVSSYFYTYIYLFLFFLFYFILWPGCTRHQFNCRWLKIAKKFKCSFLSSVKKRNNNIKNIHQSRVVREWKSRPMCQCCKLLISFKKH